jgi:hypothetical protein
MNFGHWEFDQGASVHDHFHAQEEVWEIPASTQGIRRNPFVGSPTAQCVVTSIRLRPVNRRFILTENGRQETGVPAEETVNPVARSVG